MTSAIVYSRVKIFWHEKMWECPSTHQAAMIRKGRGIEHSLILDTSNNFDILYTDQVDVVEAREKYVRTLRERKRCRDPSQHKQILHISQYSLQPLR